MKPKSLFDRHSATKALGGVLTREESEALGRKTLAMATGPGLVVVITSTISRSTHFARNEITTQRDRASALLVVIATNGSRSAQSYTQRMDDQGVREAVSEAEAMAKQGPPNQVVWQMVGPRTYAMPDGLWAASTQSVEIEACVAVAVSAINRAAGHLTAGIIDAETNSVMVMNSAGLVAFCRDSHANLSLTVRSNDNTGSGWASQSVNDFTRLRAVDVTARAVDKCERSRNPSAIEPGRYTTILEPAAYAGMINDMLVSGQMMLEGASRGLTVFAKGSGGNRIGTKVIDERLSWLYDPFDPDSPFCPFGPMGAPMERTHWIQDGILKNLAYGDAEAAKRNQEFGLPAPFSMRVQPKADVKLMSLDEMISSCERGIYVSRLSGSLSNARFATFSGVTRDGTWLIEKGRITRPLKNLRFVDSPLLFMNAVDAIGKPEVVSNTLVLPPLKVRDFNFTAIADAI